MTITYLRQAPLAPVTKLQVEPNSRKTIPVDAEGPELRSRRCRPPRLLPICRSWSNARCIRRAPDSRPSRPVTAPPASRRPRCAGSSRKARRAFFDLYVLVANPNTTASDLKVTYLLPAGAPFEKTYSVGPQQRLTIYVEEEDRAARQHAGLGDRRIDEQSAGRGRACDVVAEGPVVRSARLRRRDDDRHELGARRWRGDKSAAIPTS